MVVLLTGASGFLGRHFLRALGEAGHRTICAVRNPDRCPHGHGFLRCVIVDYVTATTAAEWAPHLQGVDVVVNAVGLLRESKRQTFAAIHVDAPKALFAACAKAGIRVVQISALGADTTAVTSYFSSKGAADQFLIDNVPFSVVVQPSLVFGAGGKSAHMFTMLASLSVVPLPGKGDHLIQPIHVDDIAAAIVALVNDSSAYAGERISLVGSTALTLKAFLASLRDQMRLPRPLFLHVPESLMTILGRIGDRLPSSLLSSKTLAMLRHGNSGSCSVTRDLLKRNPRAPAHFIPPYEAVHVRRVALLSWLLPSLRVTVAAMWIVSGIVSLGAYPVEHSYGLLALVGISGMMAPLALFGAALLDIGLGLASLMLRSRRRLWEIQALVIVVYSIIITAFMADLWLHPFGPVLKNVPLLVAIWMLRELDD